MKKAILDTNFILSAIRKKINFFEDIEFMGFKIIIPNQVIDEIKRISESKKKLRFREEAKFALKLLNSETFEKINIKGKYVDTALINYAQENPLIAIATLDKELKKKIPNPKILIRGKKLELI